MPFSGHTTEVSSLNVEGLASSLAVNVGLGLNDMIPQTQGRDVHLASSRTMSGMRQRKKMGKRGRA